jgi:signal transduction histidine kinase
MHLLLPTRNDATPALSSLVRRPALLTDAEPDDVHACKILIIDDEEPNVRILERVLTQAGFDNYFSAADSRQGAALFSAIQPDLILVDWRMPMIDDCTVLEQLRALVAPDEYLPIVVLTADITPQTKKRALTAGASDFLTKPFDQVEVLLRVESLLQTRLLHRVIRTQDATREESVRHRTIELERALTELQRTQQQVIQQERLAALGAMAAGIAHDFNNALSIIMGFGEILLRDAEHGLTKESATPPITSILNAAEDGAKIVHRLDAFYRPDECREEHWPVDLNELVEQAVLLTRPRWKTEAIADGRTIQVTTEPGEIPCVAGDAAELREALTNLIFNAVDALPQGGKITVGTHREGDNVILKVRDTGTGMRKEVRQRCLEPFFTTKGQRGTGLGLSMVFGIVQRHGGTIDVESEFGRGTTFTLSLPAAGTASATSLDGLPSTSTSLHVLVVDDEPILGQLVRGYLQDDLHTVETALSGSDALEKCRASHFDLVITDHVMTGMTGEELAIAIKEMNPQVPVILLTGYADDSTRGEQGAKAIDLVLGKPVSRTALRQACAKVTSKHVAHRAWGIAA